MVYFYIYGKNILKEAFYKGDPALWCSLGKEDHRNKLSPPTYPHKNQFATALIGLLDHPLNNK